MLRSIKKSNIGFTLTELLVSVSIIAIISSVIVGNVHYGGEKGKLNISAQKIISDLRQVQDFSLGLKEYDNGGTPVYPDGGWGIHFSLNSGSYTLYADHNDGGGGTPDRIMNGNESYFQNTLEDTIVSSIVIDGTSRNNLYAVYEPPDPTVYFCWSAGNCGNSDAVIELKTGNDFLSIYANSFGLVDIYNPNIEKPAVIVVPNSRTGRNCVSICGDLGSGFACSDVGNDPEGTNNRYDRTAACTDSNANCNRDIDNMGTFCGGKPGEWINCRCDNF